MIRPQNETWFAEQLKRTIKTEEIYIGEIVEVPAFEVEFIQSYTHERKLKFDWEYVKWKNSRQM